MEAYAFQFFEKYCKQLCTPAFIPGLFYFEKLCFGWTNDSYKSRLFSDGQINPVPRTDALPPGDPKPLATSQSSKKVSIQIALHQKLQKRK